MARIFIGIDSGTQSTKALVVDGNTGKVLGSASQAYGLIGGLPPGAKEQDPDVWIDATRKSVRAALRKAKVRPTDVLGIGVSGQQHGFVALDEAGKVIRPAKLWCDTSTAGQCEQLIRKLGGLSRVIEMTGNSIPPGFTASKILWLKQAEPKNYTRLATVLLPHDYINFWLTGERAMEHGDASGTALMDVKTRRWSETVLAAIDADLASKLPTLRGSEQPAGKVRPEAARQLGIAPGALVSAGGGDNMMGAIGTGNTRPGIVTASFGTSGTIYGYSARPVIDPEGEIAAFCDSTGGWLPLLCTMNVTVATELVKRLFAVDNDKLRALIKQSPPGADGLLLVPYFEGERTPNVPNGTGMFFGLRDATFTRAHMARAAMEGVTLGMNYGLNRLCALGLRPKEIRITGGGSKDAEWRQIMADVFATPVVAMQTSEGAAYGAALQAKWCWHLGRGERVRISAITDEFVKVDNGSRVEPRRDAVKIYKELQHIQDGFKDSCRDAFARHARLRDAR